ncbi:hypothetical protein MHBO_000107 [Bonamia ostreae]|uniref:Uncharacterized protein n=1 Tax=Bonamia ostreae TaxID=126728 RepID=A0ABV2AEF4_9EUKA
MVFSSSRNLYIVLLANTTSCLCYYMATTAFSISVGDAKRVRIYFAMPSALLGWGLLQFVRRFVEKIDYIVWAFPFLAPAFFFLSDSPVSKRGLSETGYDVVVSFLFIARDTNFWMLYVFSNLVIMDSVSLKHPRAGLNGISAALFVFCTNFGDALGLILANVLYDNHQFDYIAHLATGLILSVGSIIIFLHLFRCKRKTSK